jgi:perosamine synthetase
MIYFYPEPRLKSLTIRRGASADNLSFLTRLYTSGRAALYHLLVAVGRISKSPIIWMPAWHCGVEVQAAIDAGFEIRFYPLRPDLSIDVGAFMTAWRKDPGHLLLIHYFGFGQSSAVYLNEELTRRNFLLIEDCAHALYSSDGQQMLGGVGAAAIFSLRKTLPIFHGGALLLNDDLLAAAGYKNLRFTSLQSSSMNWLRQLGKAEFVRVAGPRITDLLRQLRGKPVIESGVLMPPELSSCSTRDEHMSPLSQRLASTADPSDVIELRRRNFTILNQELRRLVPDYRPVFTDLSDKVCPLCVPVVVPDRSRFLRHLNAAGINPFVFGSHPHPRLQEPLRLTHSWMCETIVALPIHQQLTPVEMLTIARVSAPLLSRAASMRNSGFAASRPTESLLRSLQSL